MSLFGTSEFSNSETTYVYYYGVVQESDEERQFNTDFGRIWIPKRFISAQDKEMFGIPTWLANKKGIRQVNGRFR